MTSDDILPPYNDSVPHRENDSVPVHEVVQGAGCRNPITKEKIESIAIEKYRSNRRGITTKDLEAQFLVKKASARRSFKHFRLKGVLFTAQDLIQQGIYLLRNKNPQEYYASRIKAEILENAKKCKSVLVQPTGVNPQKYSQYPLSNPIEHQKAQSFLEVLVLLAYAPHIYTNYNCYSV